MNKRKTQVSGTPLRRWWTVVWFFDMFVADSWLCLSFWLRLWYWIYNNCLGLVFSHVSCNCHPQTIPNITALMSFVSEHNTLFHISLSLSLNLWGFLGWVCEWEWLLRRWKKWVDGTETSDECGSESFGEWRERDRERERGKRWWIYAARRFLSFTMFGSWIFLQAFSSVFQRFPIPEIRKQP